MTIKLTDDMSPDEVLVAYLDGALGAEDSREVEARLESEPAFAARLAELDFDIDAFRAAFEPMLDEAPRARLETAIPKAAPPVRAGRRALLSALAAAVAGIAIGIGGTGVFLAPRGEDSEPWPLRLRKTVASYMRLYTDQTFAQQGGSAAMQAQLARVSSELGLNITSDAIQLPGVEFRRAETLNYEGHPLAQIGYVDPTYGPMAFCIAKAEFGHQPPIVDRQHDMNMVYWSSGRYAYIVIGRNPVEELQQFTNRLRSRFSA